MKIEIAMLKKISIAAFEYFEKNKINHVELEDDYFWAVSNKERYNPYVEPTNLTLGQLTDDLNELEMIIKGNRPITGYAMVLLSSILQYIGEKFPE